MTYVRAAVIVTLLLFLWPLATPAGPAYGRLLGANVRLVLEGAIGLALALIWTLRRLGALLFLRSSGRRLRAAAHR